MIVLICCVGAKNDLFPIFVKVISRKAVDIHRGDSIVTDVTISETFSTAADKFINTHP